MSHSPPSPTAVSLKSGSAGARAPASSTRSSGRGRAKRSYAPHRRPFAATHVQWIRWRHKIPYPTNYAHGGELTVSQIATCLGVSTGVIYAWISTGKLTARSGPANRLYILFPPDVEQQCRERVQNSVHLSAETKNRAAGGAV